MSSKEHKEKIWNLVENVKVGMLCTQLDDGIHARPMHIVQDSYDGHIWFYTNLKSEKVFEVKKNKDVCLTSSCPEKEIYVSLSGTAQLNRDPGLIDKFWNPFIASWFPNGKDDTVGLIQIHVHGGEHWDSTTSKLLQIYEMVKANVTDTTPNLGENEKFGSVET